MAKSCICLAAMSATSALMRRSVLAVPSSAPGDGVGQVHSTAWPQSREQKTALQAGGWCMHALSSAPFGHSGHWGVRASGAPPRSRRRRFSGAEAPTRSDNPADAAGDGASCVEVTWDASIRPRRRRMPKRISRSRHALVVRRRMSATRACTPTGDRQGPVALRSGASQPSVVK